MILAIDLGSTAFKTAVIGRKDEVVSTSAAPLTYNFGAGGMVEMEPEMVASAARSAISEAVSRVPGGDAIEAVAIASQAQTFTLFSEGRCRRPFISWQDVRAKASAEALADELPDFARHCSFYEPLPNLCISQLRTLRDTGHGAREDDLVMGLPSYVAWMLTGELATDDNIAAMGGLYSLQEGSWHGPAMSAAGVTEANMPRVVTVGEQMGVTSSAAAKLGLREHLPVILAGNDQTAGAYGAGVHKQVSGDSGEKILITLGTAVVVYRCAAAMPSPRAQTVRGGYPGGLGYCLTIGAVGGNLVNWGKKVLAGCGTDESFFAAAAGAEADCGGLVLRINDDERSCTLDNIGLHHTPAEIARSVLKAICDCATEMVSRLTCDAKPDHGVMVAGGGSRQPIFRQMLSDAIGAPLQVTHASPLDGAARMAFGAICGKNRD